MTVERLKLQIIVDDSDDDGDDNERNLNDNDAINDD